MIYNITQIGSNNILLNLDVMEIDPFFLTVFKMPCYNGDESRTKTAFLNYQQECEGKYIMSFDGVQEEYEDLDDGMIYYNMLGTWSADLYVQDNDLNTDPDNAEFLITIELQVNG